MEITPANKTEVISWIIEEIVLKLWNVSRRMRKRLKWMLKNKIIVVKNWSETLLKLSQNVRETQSNENQTGMNPFDALEQALECQEDVDSYFNREKIFLKFNLRCSLNPTYFKHVTSLEVFGKTIIFYENLYFGRVKRVSVSGANIDQVKDLLDRIESIEELTVTFSNSEKLDLSSKKINKISFRYVKFNNLVILPWNLRELHLIRCSDFNRISCENLAELKIGQSEWLKPLEEIKEEALLWLKSLKKLKKVDFTECLGDYIEYLPTSIRRIEENQGTKTKLSLHKMKQKYPYLHCFYGNIDISVAEELKLREISNVNFESDRKTSCRPRKIKISDSNAETLNEHPEIFEEIEFVEINAKKFDLSVLSASLSKMLLINADTESEVLNRFKGKFE